MTKLIRWIPVREEMVRNAFPVDAWTKLERFLILGSEGGTYYVSEPELTVENASNLRTCLREDGPRVVRTITEISVAGRAPKSEPALFALALASAPRFAAPEVNAAALEALAEVARTASHLATFVSMARALRGWGRSLRSAVADWYTRQPLQALAYQMAKYRSREGWAHGDLLRVAHPKPPTAGHDILFRWAVGGSLDQAPLEYLLTDLRQVYALELARTAATEGELVHLIRDERLTHEMIPSEWKKSVRVWEALAEHMPYTALLRNPAKLSALGVLEPGSETTRRVAERLTDADGLRRARVHPVAVLSALMAYRTGAGVGGRLKWVPAAEIIDALDAAFYAAFTEVEPVGRRIYLALDASGSMQSSVCSGLPHISAAMASVAMAMAVARTETGPVIAAFHDEVWNVDITPRDRLDRAAAAITRSSRATDASLPFREALRRGLAVDAFVVLTDNETWAGDRHPVQALADYRRATGIPARLVVVAMAANRYSIVDPDDALQMDVAGFDASVPEVVRGFIAG